MEFRLSELEHIVNIDGVKLAIDIKSSSIFIWESYAEKEEKVFYNSKWIVLRRVPKHILIKFLKGKSFRSLYKKMKPVCAFLKNDLDTLVIDDNFLFKIVKPDITAKLERAEGKAALKMIKYLVPPVGFEPT